MKKASMFLCVAVVYFIMWSFTGRGILSGNPYYSYSLQAESWLNGRLDVSSDHLHLELAIYNGKYYISFPPLPSVVMLPFVIVFGINTPDNIINITFVLLTILFAFKTAKNFYLPDNSAVIISLFYVLGSNIVFLMLQGWVWFLAQNMSIAFCTISIYYLTTPKASDSRPALLFLALAVGCRPLQAIYVVLTVYLIYIRYESINLDYSRKAYESKAFDAYGLIKNFFAFVIDLAVKGAPALAVCGCYLAFNYIRFGNIFEYGHNYLPEFTRSERGQFDLLYLLNNMRSLVYIPKTTKLGLDYPFFDGFSMFMVYPMLSLALPVALYRLIKKSRARHYKAFISLSLIVITIHILLLCTHRTMGGWHFGNRYITDCLPYVFLLFISLADYDSDLYNRSCLPFFIFGLVLNTLGTVVAFRGL